MAYKILALIAGAVMVGLTALAIVAVTGSPRPAPHPPGHQAEIFLLPVWSPAQAPFRHGRG
jgi:hypothetical protein